MTDAAWIDLALVSARPQAMGALLRYFRNLDLAEEAFQEACIRALKTWPKNGPPRDPAAWLIFVGRNSGIDKVRRQARETALPPEELLSDLEDREGELADRLDGSHYRDDILRLLFVCSNPVLPATQQIALALRIVSGLSVRQIARAFLVSEAAMEQRITRAKARVAADLSEEGLEDVKAEQDMQKVMADQALREFYQAHAGKTARMTDMLEQIKTTTGYDATACADMWLKSTTKPAANTACP